MDDFLQDDSDTVTILSIDPGTIRLGFSIIKLSIKDLEIVEAFAWTIEATRLEFYKEDVVLVHGEKFARIIAIKKMFKYVLEFYRPLSVVCESPFFNMTRPSAAGPLYELLATIEQTVFEWDDQKPLYKVEPKTVKKAVGASANAKKDEVRVAVSKVPELQCACLDFLDEHAIDAIAVGYAYINQSLRNRKE
jgi:Holliday junction resolvasome RuvABC endonuclease subunit